MTILRRERKVVLQGAEGKRVEVVFAPPVIRITTIDAGIDAGTQITVEVPATARAQIVALFRGGKSE